MTSDIFTTLTISAEEARNGTACMVPLPDGKQITVAVPGGAYDGQVLRIPGVIPSAPGGPISALLVTLQVQTTSQASPANPPSGPYPTIPATPAYGSGANWQPQGQPVVPVGGTSGQYAAVSPTIHSSGPNWPAQVQTPAPVGGTSGQYPPLAGSGPNWPAQGQSGISAAPSSAPNWQNQQMTPVAAPLAPASGRSLSTTMLILLVIAVLVVLFAASLGSIVLFENNAKTAAQNNAIANATSTTLARYSTGTAMTNAAATPQYATATALAQNNAHMSNPYNGSGQLFVNDSLQRNDSGANWYWEQDNNCVFKDGGYHVLNASSRYIQMCGLATTRQLVDYAVEFKMAILQGDVGGIIFRNDPLGNNIQAYMLTFDTQGGYQLNYYDVLSTAPHALSEGHSSAFHTGYGQVNTVAVVAQGSTITWYANGQQVGSIHDGRFNEGGVRLTDWVYSGHSGKSEAAFSDLHLWML